MPTKQNFTALIIITLSFLTMPSWGDENIEPTLIPEGKVKMETSWRVCKVDLDCTWVHYGCGGTAAVNRIHLEKATEKAYREGGDPRAMSCAIPSLDPKIGAAEVLCRDSLCGVYSFPRCKDAECNAKFSQCKINRKYFLDPKNRESYGASQSVVWGPSQKSCIARCKREVEAVSKRISHPNQGLYEFECSLDGKIVHQDQIKGMAMSQGF